MVDVRSNASIIQIDSGGHIRFVLMYFERVVCISTINEQDKLAGSIVCEAVFRITPNLFSSVKNF